MSRDLLEPYTNDWPLALRAEYHSALRAATAAGMPQREMRAAAPGETHGDTLLEKLQASLELLGAAEGARLRAELASGRRQLAELERILRRSSSGTLTTS